MLDFIPTDHPVTMKVLCERTGWPEREVQAAIQQARLEGAPIISDGDGYRLSQDPAEVRACARRLRSRALNQMATAAALDRAADALPLTLWSAE